MSNDEIPGIDPKDLQVVAWPQPWRCGMQTGKIYPGVKITHIPTGISCSCAKYRSQYQNRNEAINMLASTLTGRRS